MENIGAAYVVYTDEMLLINVLHFLADFDREQEDLCFFFEHLYQKDTLSCLLY
jgi:hypothetical protein